MTAILLTILAKKDKRGDRSDKKTRKKT